MTETSTTTQARSDPAMPIRPADVFMDLIVAFLAPMFLSVTGGDVGHARLAAIETVNGYRARNPADLLSIAQIIAFGLTTLSSLSLSMDDNLPLSTILRLRSNAATLNRAAAQCRRVLLETPPAAATPQAETAPKDDGPSEAAVLAGIARAEQAAAEFEASMRHPAPPAAPVAPAQAATAPVDQPALTNVEQRNLAVWAAGMTKVAKELAADLQNLSPAERREAALQAAVLSEVASELMSGTPVPPASLPKGWPSQV